MNRVALFDGLRHGPFPGKLTAGQVNGVSELLDEWQGSTFVMHHGNPVWLAYILAGVLRETGGLMVPVREGFQKTDAAAAAYVKRQGYKYAAAVNGHVYYGRGRIQNTWDYNYRSLSLRFGVDLYNDPDAILRDGILDARITIAGHVEGIWTKGKHTLARYFPDGGLPDWTGARHIVNGTDHAAEIAGHAKQIYADLKLAGA